MHWLFRSRFRRGATLVLIDLLFFGSTNPTHVSLIVLVPALLLLAATLYGVIGSLLLAAHHYAGYELKNRRRLALTLTACSAGLLALQSIRELSARDVLILLPFAAVAYMYASYGRVKAAD